jgi:plastocyanin
MRDLRLALPVGLAFAALAAAGCGDGNDEGSATTSTADAPRLIATVGSREDPDSYEISLTTEDGEEITTVLAGGEYQLEISDLSTIHNFHLAARQEGVELATEVRETVERTTVVNFQEPQAYIYFCDAHPAKMEVTFSIHDRIRTQN